MKNRSNPIRREVFVSCNNGTKFKIVYAPLHCGYIVLYRNDRARLLTIMGDKKKGEWLYLDVQPNYGDALAFMFEEISSIDAVFGEK